jgi:predicted ABC-type transport system involved in lysophospholipase L1 biosynthesis ATPase subunit
MNTDPGSPGSSTEADLVRLRDVTRTFGTAAASVTALRAVSLTIRRGERVALLGKSGSGKSTLLHLLGGLDRPTSGSVEVAGRDLAAMSPGHLAGHRLRTVGVIFQSFNLITTRTALQNVELPMVFAGLPARVRREKARQALEAVGLGQRLGHRPTQLSGGEGQRVAIARALVNDPALVLADEPTGNLDSATAGAIMELLLGHVARLGATLVLVTHDQELARRNASRVVWLRDGRIDGDELVQGG